MDSEDLTPKACALLHDLGLTSAPIEPVDSFSHAVWLTEEHAVRYHVIGPVGRLEHEARVAARLPAAALYPEIVAVGRDGEHDWLVTRRAPGVSLPEAWPGMTPGDRRDAIFQAVASAAGAPLGSVAERNDGIPPRDAIFQAVAALRAVHGAPVTDLIPPCLQGGAPTLTRGEMIERLIKAGLGSLEPLADAMDGTPTVMAHGDFNFNQVIWSEGRVTALLDLEMSHAEAPDWDLPPFLGFCANPARAVPERLEAASRVEDYREAPGWLREAYPEMFGSPRQSDRLLLHFLVFRAAELLADPSRVNSVVGACLEEVRAIEMLLPD